MYFEDDPRILVSKIHYEFAKVGAFRSQEMWQYLRIADFYEDHQFQTIEMKNKQTPFFRRARLLYKILPNLEICEKNIRVEDASMKRFLLVGL